VRARLTILLCLTVASSTFPVGAFPALLPDLDRVVGLSNVQLGALAAGFGFARMVVDVPVGLLVARRLRIALLASPVVLSLGILAIGSGGPFPVLLGGRVLMGVAHALGMVAWLTTLLRFQQRSLGAALSAVELSGMLGMLAGVTTVGLLPRTVPWNHALLIACAPQLAGIALAPFVVRAVRRAETLPSAAPVLPAPQHSRPRPVAPVLVLAFVAGSVVAATYSSIELYFIPLRGSRELGLDRTGVARLLTVVQVADILALLPAGLLADRIGVTRMLAIVMALLATGAALVSFGGLGLATAGAAVFGLGMAGWMLPLAVLRRETPPERVAWRTALYRVGVDAGLFAGPFIAGLLGTRAALLPGTLAVVLATLAALLIAPDLTARRRASPAQS
jgi:MFS family permease